MYGINYQQSVYMLVVLINDVFKNKIDKHLVKAHRIMAGTLRIV